MTALIIGFSGRLGFKDSSFTAVKSSVSITYLVSTTLLAIASNMNNNNYNCTASSQTSSTSVRQESSLGAFIMRKRTKCVIISKKTHSDRLKNHIK